MNMNEKNCVYEELCYKMEKTIEKRVKFELQGFSAFDVIDVSVTYSDNSAEVAIAIEIPFYKAGKYIANVEKHCWFETKQGKRKFAKWLESICARAIDAAHFVAEKNK